MTRKHSDTVRLRPLNRCHDAPGDRLGPYVLIGQLARGGTASVYLAQHETTAQRVALKVLSPSYRSDTDMVERLLREHDLGTRARHPGLLEITASGFSDGVPFLVMEMLDGESLDSLIERDELAPDAIIGITVQITTALAALHAAGVVHCDLKPDNVFVLYERGFAGWPKIKIVDYGVSRLVEEPEQQTVAGTPAFMPPEQWRGKPCEKSDVYALGCMLYELTTKHPLFSGTIPELMTKHYQQLPERPSTYAPTIDPDLERLIMRALAKDPALRPTIAEMQAELLSLAYRSSYTQPLYAAG